MLTLTPKTKPIHAGIMYIGGVEVNEDGVKNIEWCYPPRTRKDDAYRDADELKEAYDETNS